MPLLDEELRNRLPRLRSQEAEVEPFVYARFYLPGTLRAWYVTEGEPRGEDYIFFGFVTVIDQFCEFRLSELEAIRDLFGSPVERDHTFTAGRLTDVVPAPDS